MTFSSALHLPALFHAGSTLGVLPYRVFTTAFRPCDFLWCSSSPSPTPLPSCRCDALPSASSLTDFPISQRPASSFCSSPNAPRLQGFAPHQSLPLRAGGLDRSERMALMGFFVLQGVLPLRHNRAFTRFPLLRSLVHGRKRPSPQHFRVFISEEIGLSTFVSCLPS